MIQNRAFFLILRRMRLPLLLLIVTYAVSILGLVLMPGTDLEGRPHHLSFFHAFYIVTYTATTTGFGEIPYPFSDAQRLWVTFSLYITVVAWLYAIGTLITLMRDPAFKQVLLETRFARQVRRIVDPFYIVCGYGDTGSLVVEGLCQHGMTAVVIDDDQDRINELLLEDLSVLVPGLCADANQPGKLLLAGLKRPNCLGVVALTNQDPINLQIAITTKLLSAALKAICRAHSHDTEANMESFGTDAVINPFDLFADHLTMALHSPDMYYLYETLSTPPGKPLPQRIKPPRGNWILCGYGRFGKAVSRYFDYEGLPLAIIEKEPELTSAPKNTILGRGTEAITLREAHIEKAVGIVAGTDNDANNLSIIVTAHELNPRLFKVARQNKRENDLLFEAASLDLVMQRARIIATKIMSLISAPLFADFLRLARHHSNEWAQESIKKLLAVIGDAGPDLWSITINDKETPAVYDAFLADREIRLSALLHDGRRGSDEILGIPLLLSRGEKETLFPDLDTPIQLRDRVLLCGGSGVAGRMRWTLHDHNALRYIESGKTHPDGLIWRWLEKRRSYS